LRFLHLFKTLVPLVLSQKRWRLPRFYQKLCAFLEILALIALSSKTPRQPTGCFA
jgi:hypothetical protein